MSISIVGILVIAALLFAVTMLVAVGPLLLCRIVASPGKDECRPQPRRSSLASSVLTFCGIFLGAAVGLFVLYFIRHSVQDHSAATVVYDDIVAEEIGTLPPEVMGGAAISPVPIELPPETPVVFTEHTLFAPPPPLAPPHPAPPYADAARPLFSKSDAVEIGSMVLTVLLLLTLAGAVVSERIRTGIARGVPVLLAVGLLGVLFFWTSARTTPQIAGLDTYPPPATAMVAAVDRSQEPADAPGQRRRLPTAAESVRILSEFPGTDSDEVSPDAAVDGVAEADQASNATVPVLTFVGTSTEGLSRDSLPQWTSLSDDDGPVRVIDSGLHATVRLAEEHALRELKSLLQAEMAQRTPQAAGWQAPDQAVLNAGNILQRAVERSQIQVGENTIPMYEAYWQVDVSRLEPLYRAWRPSIVRQRLLQIGGALALAMLLLASLAGVLRVDEQTHGRRRKSLAAGTLALWAVIGSGLALFVA